jgi:hypothetical protein
MLKRFIFFLFYILHLDFLLKNLLFGKTSSQFFGTEIKFDFNKSDVQEALVISAGFILAIIFGISIFKVRKVNCVPAFFNANTASLRFYVGLFELSILIPIGFIAYSLIVNGLDYGKLTYSRSLNTFVLELRIIPLILLSYFILNFPISWFRGRLFRRVSMLFLLYLTLIIFYQVRSLIFEVGIIFFFLLIKKNKDKFKFYHLTYIPFLLVIPNLVILHRLNYPAFDFIDLFSIEYSIVLNKFLISAINSRDYFFHDVSNLNQLLLLIPSPIRAFLEIDATQNNLFSQFSDYSGVSGGGFSLLSQVYLSFGLFGFFIFFLIGVLLGYFRKKFLESKSVILYSCTPLLFGSFFLAFRNDLMVFVKYSIQLIIISYFFQLIDRSFQRYHKE